jgi:hypothetical protein
MIHLLAGIPTIDDHNNNNNKQLGFHGFKVFLDFSLNGLLPCSLWIIIGKKFFWVRDSEFHCSSLMDEDLGRL